jgi:hypothetical protein
MVAAGESLLRALDKAAVEVTAALWLLAPGESEWRLVISAPDIASKGPHAFYQKIDHALRRLGGSPLSMSLVSALLPTHPLLALLRVALGRVPGISRLRFRQNVINGQFIPDALIYRLL